MRAQVILVMCWLCSGACLPVTLLTSLLGWAFALSSLCGQERIKIICIWGFWSVSSISLPRGIAWERERDLELIIWKGSRGQNTLYISIVLGCILEDMWPAVLSFLHISFHECLELFSHLFVLYGDVLPGACRQFTALNFPASLPLPLGSERNLILELYYCDVGVVWWFGLHNVPAGHFLIDPSLCIEPSNYFWL